MPEVPKVETALSAQLEDEDDDDSEIVDKDISVPDNLVAMEDMTDKSLLEAIKKRYKANIIYTFVADILLAVNPYRLIKVYGKKYKERYDPTSPIMPKPHVFAIAQAAAKNLKLLKRNQVCLISGESGAGKTETAKQFMNHLLHFSGGGAGDQNALERKILESQPVLEAFGNAKTGLNDNSSRFGKFMEVLYEDEAVIGARISKYLLEKSRVVAQAEGEKAYHIFFYLTNGCDDTLRNALDIGRSSEYKFLAATETDTDDILRYKELVGTMEVLGFLAEEIRSMWTILAVILKAGQLVFEDNVGSTDDSSSFADGAVGADIASILQVDATVFEDALTTKHIVTAGETFHKPLDASKACESRDTFVQNMYDNLFAWLTRRLNTILAPETSSAAEYLSVGVLDIFGFENFENNSFEQLCINTANEQLQFFFNQHIFQWEMKELKQEGVKAPAVEYKDNASQVELLLGKPVGVFSVLDEQVKVPRATDQTTITKLHKTLADDDNYDDMHTDQIQFQVTHYAQAVKYQIKGFLDKNRNARSIGLVEMVQSSKLELAARLFDAEESTSDRIAGSRRGSKAALGKGLKKRKTLKQRASKFFGRGKKASTRGQDTRAKKAHLNTLGAEFRSSLCDLMLKLTASQPHFVRCIKPNLLKAPGQFDGPMVNKQLTYTGVLATTKIRANGYPLRLKFGEFIERCVPHCRA